MAKDTKNIAGKEVMDFLGQCAEVAGFQARDSFSQGAWCEYIDLEIESPIEQFFYTAISLLVRIGGVPLHDADIIDGKPSCWGLHIKPQHTVERYRADFYLAWYGYPHKRIDTANRQVIVECDSQEWHERSEQERRYEKKRDRDFQRLDYKVFRFTGKEIKDEPFRVALEVLNYVTDEDHSDLLAYIDDLRTA